MIIKLRHHYKKPDMAGYRLFHRMEGEKYACYDPYCEGIEIECAIDISGEGMPHFFILWIFDEDWFRSSNSYEIYYGVLLVIESTLTLTLPLITAQMPMQTPVAFSKPFSNNLNSINW